MRGPFIEKQGKSLRYNFDIKVVKPEALIKNF